MRGNVYAALRATDIIGYLEELFLSYGYKLREEDGKIYASMHPAVDTPGFISGKVTGQTGKILIVTDGIKFNSTLFQSICQTHLCRANARSAGK